MATKRKPNNNRARIERASKAALRQSKLAVYNIDPDGRQGLCNWQTGIKYRPSRHVADAIFDMSHQLVIYISAFCEDQAGKRYYKSVEIAPDGIYHTNALSDVLEEHYLALLDSCNPSHIVGSGWIANPCGHSLDEAGAAKIFGAVGAWPARSERHAPGDLVGYSARRKPAVKAQIYPPTAHEFPCTGNAIRLRHLRYQEVYGIAQAVQQDQAGAEFLEVD